MWSLLPPGGISPSGTGVKKSPPAAARTSRAGGASRGSRATEAKNHGSSGISMRSRGIPDALDADPSTLFSKSHIWCSDPDRASIARPRGGLERLRREESSDSWLFQMILELIDDF